MKKRTIMLFGVFLFLLTGIMSAGNVFFQEDFSTPNAAIPAMDEFGLEEVDTSYGKSLRITRVSKSHEKILFPVTTPIEAGQNCQFSIDYKGIGYFMLLDAQKQQICGLSFDENGRIVVLSTEKDKWGQSGLKAYTQDWFTIKLRLNAADKNFTFTVKDVDGESEAREWPVISDAPIAYIQLGNSYPIGNVAFADNLMLCEAETAQSEAEGKIIVLDCNFEKPLTVMKGLENDFAIEADPEAKPEFEKSLKISRPTKSHEKIIIPFRKPLPAQHDFTIVMDYKGIGYFFLLDANRQQLGGMVFGAKPKALSASKDNFVGTPLQCNQTKWNHYEINFKMSEGTFAIRMTNEQGEVSETPDYPLVGDGQPAQIQFGNSYPIGNVSFIDNLQIYYDTATSLSGRQSMLSSDEVVLTGLTPVAAENGMSFELTAEQGKIEFHPATLREFSLIRFVTDQNMAVSMTLTNSAGHTILVSNEGKTGYYEKELKPTMLESGVIEISGQPGTVLKELGFWSPYLGNVSTLNREFEEKLQGDFRLPVYEGNAPALLMLYNQTASPLPVSITLQERKTKKAVHEPLKATLKTGENKISLPIEDLPNGEFLVFITDDSTTEALKGSLCRLLRRQVVPEPVPPAVLQLSGKKLFLPDAWQLEKSSNLQFHQSKAEAYPVTDHPMTEDAYLQHGGMMTIDQGKLWLSFYTINEAWQTSSHKSYVAVCDNPDKPEKWEITSESGANPPKLPAPYNIQSRFESAKPQKGDDGKEHWRLYRKDSDGAPQMAQLEIKFISSQPSGTLGYEANETWEDITPGSRTHWPVWHKGPGESLLLSKTPILEDGYPGGLEDGYESNDNFGGQWTDDNGEHFFFSHGRILRRYEPLNIPYDNLAKVSRILTVFRTKDGLTWDRAYMALPTMDDPIGCQHYGALHFKAKDGGPYLAFVYKYYADQQRFCNDFAYSWDGFCWKQFHGDGILWDNTPPKTWCAGSVSPSHEAFNYNGKLYWLMNWQNSAYHFYGEFANARDTVTGESIQKRFAGRQLDKWPLFKAFDNDYDKLAQDIKNEVITPAVMILREDGFFYAEGKDTPATFTTLPIQAPGAKLTANAVVAQGGYLKVSLCGLDGKILQTKTLSTGDYLNQPLDLTAPGANFKLTVEMKNTKLYTIGF